jgi:hypothetical protein
MPMSPDNTTYWLSTKTRLKDPTITLHLEGCPILRISQRRTLGVLTGPLTRAQVAALPAQGYQACGRCKPATPSLAVESPVPVPIPSRGGRRRQPPR